MELGLTAGERDGVTVLVATGELDLGSAPRVRELAIRHLLQGDRSLVIDLAGVDFIDSTGLGTLVAILKRARSLGAELHLVVPNERIRHIFELTGLTTALPMHDDLDDAVKAAAGVE